MTNPQKTDWKKEVESSGGNLVFLPDKFHSTAEKILKKSDEFNEDARKLAEKEITLNVENQNMFLEFRKYMAENGMEEIWMKDVGWNADALKDKVFIVNISEPMRR